ncbi:MAG: heavy metal translocating P-type ATPase [Chitinivibrionales bacterium]|nr:heavy metal translocating P-type ATPase [Chitinivibrionales bacterium]
MSNNCIVCNRSITDDAAQFCCPGCEAVHQIVGKMALTGAAREERVATLLQGIFPNGLDNDPIAFSTPRSETDEASPGSENREFSFQLGGMVCPACSWLIHNTLTNAKGVSGVNVNFIAETCSLNYDPMQIGKDAIEKKIERIGYQFIPEGAEGQDYNYYRFGAGWFFAANAMMFSFVVYSAETFAIPLSIQIVSSIILFIFGTLTPLYATRSIMIAGFNQLRLRDFRMETLIVVSTTAAWLYSVHSLITGNFAELYFDVVALLLMLIETGNLITASFYRRLNKRITSMRQQLPKKARIAGAVDDYKPIEQLALAETFVVVRDELVPTDGILQDRAEFDFSFISGESAGITLEAGQLVGAGARLISARAAMHVPPTGRSSLTERIIESTIAAFNTRKEEKTLGDTISSYFVPTIFALTAVVFGIHLIAGNLHSALIIMLSMLIVSCPCAFGIAEPLVLTAGIDWIRKVGIQIFNGNVLSKIPDYIIFDKTGTLTRGVLKVASVHWIEQEHPRYLDILASMETGIEHPIARALTTLGRDISLDRRTIKDSSVEADVEGQSYIAGSFKRFPDCHTPHALQDSTLVYFGRPGDCIAIIELADEVNEDSPDLIRRLHQRNLRTSICSGDRHAVVEKIAAQLSIDDYRSEMSSDDKLAFINEKQKEQRVMMVGDGVNDAQALATADVGISVFSGQLPAKMSSDGAFLTRSISPLIKMLDIVKIIRHKILLNYGWSFLYNIIGIGLAASGLLSPKYCAFGMVFSNFVVIFNSMFKSQKLKQVLS